MGFLYKLGNIASKIFNLDGSTKINYNFIEDIIDMVNEIHSEQKIKIYFADLENLQSDDISKYHVGDDTKRCVECKIQYQYPSNKESVSLCGDEKHISILTGGCTKKCKYITKHAYDFDSLHSDDLFKIRLYLDNHWDDISRHEYGGRANILVIPAYIYDIYSKLDREIVKNALRQAIICKESENRNIGKRLKESKDNYFQLLAIKKLEDDMKTMMCYGVHNEENNHD